ncbi:hypothetical protein [Alkalihalobacterium elongatum]|uniref:hypothetical protein n=1 Tax=Alkalihalobacterium elongatum TaxID=2675466 RepID=UPI001C200417|nr:hypothetical protein [Alkalihalobacterium elongatum]
MSVKIKIIKSIKHFSDIEDIYGDIWGVSNKVPLHNLITVARHGGVILGAFNKQEKMIGFSYGFPGVNDLNSNIPKIYLCSHILGVIKEYRNLGIGEELKWAQYDYAYKMGYTKILWTFDPLEAINAKLNFHKLGAISNEYIENCYGFINDHLNKGIPTDRLVVDWELKHSLVQKRSLISSKVDAREYFEVGKVNGTVDKIEWELGNLKEIPCNMILKLPVPVNIQKIKQNNTDLARKWRYQFREVMRTLFASGYKITDFIASTTELNHFYILSKNR